jgi:Uma2 family endonuclease
MVAIPSRAPAHLPPPRPGLHVRMSYEEYLVWAPEHLWAEWKDGEALVFMPASTLHQQIISRLLVLLDFFVRARNLGEVLSGPLVAKLWPGGPAREPDVLFISHERKATLGDMVYIGGPDLMVEAISPDSAHRDRIEKREEYARAGVREYWIIEPREGKRRRRSLTVYRLDPAGQYGPGEVVHSGVVHSTVLPGFWMPVDWLWQAVTIDPQTLLATILRHPEGPDGPEVRETLHAQPWAKPLLQEGRAEGIEVGRAEGMEIGIARGLEVGRVEGLRTSIRLVLSARFGSVPPRLEHAIQGLTREEDLATLLQQALTASTIDELPDRWTSL